MQYHILTSLSHGVNEFSFLGYLALNLLSFFSIYLRNVPFVFDVDAHIF